MSGEKLTDNPGITGLSIISDVAIEHGINDLVKNGFHGHPGDYSIDATKETSGDNLSDVNMFECGEESSVENECSKEENGITKGIVLNANLFAHATNSALVAADEMNEKNNHELVERSKCIEENKKATAEDLTQTNMSFLRKIAFGVSFLPSITFVFGFAIIFPCREPPPPTVCTKQLWFHTLKDNNTLATNLEISDSILLGVRGSNIDRLLSIDAETGKELWSQDLQSKPIYIGCSDFGVNDNFPYCLLTEKSKKLRAFNSSNGSDLWNLQLDLPRLQPAILSDCDNDGRKEIAIAAIPSYISIISNGNRKTLLKLKECKDNPQNILSWPQQNPMNLVFTCKDFEGNDAVRFLEQNTWCQELPEVSVQSQKLTNIQQSDVLILPIPEGLIVWLKQSVMYYRSNGAKIWEAKVSDHFFDRFLKFGNYSCGNQVTLISSKEGNGSLITLLDALNGEMTLTNYIPDDVAKIAITVSGEENDHLLILFEAFQNSETHMLSPDTNETGFLYSSNETSNLHALNMAQIEVHQIKEKVRLFDFTKKDKTTVTLDKEILSETIELFRKREIDVIELEASVVMNGDQANVLHLFIGRTFEELKTGYLKNTTSIKAFSVKSWDKTVSKCR